MSRAFILIDRERRRDGPHRQTFMNTPDGGPREIPIRTPEDERQGPVVTTTMKAITFLVGYTTGLVIVMAFIFRFVVSAEITSLELKLSNDYAKKGEIIGAALYHAEQSAQDVRMRAMEDEVRLIRDKQDRNTTRLDRLEGSSINGNGNGYKR